MHKGVFKTAGQGEPVHHIRGNSILNLQDPITYLFCFGFFFFRSQVLLCWNSEVQVWFWHMVRMNFSIHVHLSHLLCANGSATPVCQQWCLQADKPPSSLPLDLRSLAFSSDYSNRETTSVSLKLSNFAIKCLPGYLVAEHQILLFSDSQKPVTSTTPWHLIMGVCYRVKHLLWVASLPAICEQFVQI